MNVRVAAVAVAALIAGCRSPAPPELSLAPIVATTVAPGELGCAHPFDEVDVNSTEGRYRVAVAIVDAVRAGWCDPIEPDARVCRSLFLIGLTDPLVGIGLGLAAPMIDELTERHAWGLEEGVIAAVADDNAALAAALRDLAALGLVDALAEGPDAVAAVAVQRAAASIIEPIADAEMQCRNL